MTCGWVNDDPFTFYFSYISVSLYLLIWLRLFLMLSLPISISLFQYTFRLHLLFLYNIRLPTFPSLFLPLQFHYTILVSPFIFPYLPLSLSPSFLSNLSTHIHTSPSSRLYDWFRLDSVIWGRLQITSFLSSSSSDAVTPPQPQARVISVLLSVQLLEPQTASVST